MPEPRHEDRREALPATKHIAGQRLLWNPAAVSGPPTPDWFDSRIWQVDDRIVATATGRGAAWFVSGGPAGDTVWVLRHYRRGGMLARFNPDCYLWTGPRRSRAHREFRMLSTLRAAGFAVPEPIAARTVRVGGFWIRADLITRAIPCTCPLADRLLSAPVATTVWTRIGEQIAALHSFGVWHADLNARNILLGETDTPWVIDFDRARFRSTTLTGWRYANLSRLKRSLDKFMAQSTAFCFQPADWQSVIRGYERAFERRL
ncbi:3-deoxy-D-manno-octulosonic acid kinase [uncultured Salinisphaera sp.]|uniref:3-deoxy-D-manno-octulosonic acid kinase n=1 Tax=uncultured Salinisphaera sp. TaxID=359372 RepID=UPI0032B237C1